MNEPMQSAAGPSGSTTRKAETRTAMTKIQTICLAAITVAAPFAHIACGQGAAQNSQRGSKTAYPIEHLVVIFQENISFDHYFATYPVALNLPGEPPFVAKPGTPTVNGLTPDLRTRNQNSLQPQRLDPSHAHTSNQNHDSPNEQEAFNHGLMDNFVEFTAT